MEETNSSALNSGLKRILASKSQNHAPKSVEQFTADLEQKLAEKPRRGITFVEFVTNLPGAIARSWENSGR